MRANGSTGFGATLGTRVVRAPRPHAVRSIKVPGLGRVMFTRDRGVGTIFAREVFSSELFATHRGPDGRIIHEYDLGSGLVTDAGVLAMCNDFAWPTSAATIARNTIRVANNHASGTGATAAAVTDIKLQTPSGFGGQTLTAGVQSLVQGTAAGTGTTGNHKYQSVATINYTGTETVSEWGLFGDMGAIGGTALTSATGSPFTAGSASTGTVTGTPLTASANGAAGQGLTIIENTNATRVSWGLVLSNTTSIVTVGDWYLTATGAAGTAPVNADTYVFRPLIWDHRVFTGIGVNSGDSIQFTYQLQINQGG
jgi:hypothetical protein